MMRSRVSIDTLDRIVVSIYAYHISCIDNLLYLPILLLTLTKLLRK